MSVEDLGREVQATLDEAAAGARDFQMHSEQVGPDSLLADMVDRDLHAIENLACWKGADFIRNTCRGVEGELKRSEARMQAAASHMGDIAAGGVGQELRDAALMLNRAAEVAGTYAGGPLSTIATAREKLAVDLILRITDLIEDYQYAKRLLNGMTERTGPTAYVQKAGEKVAAYGDRIGFPFTNPLS